MNYAILQTSTILGEYLSPEGNRKELLDELKLTVLGQFFAESFARRAELFDANLPSEYDFLIRRFILTPAYYRSSF